MIVVQYHCDECGKFVKRDQAVWVNDKLTNRKRLLCYTCYTWDKIPVLA